MENDEPKPGEPGQNLQSRERLKHRVLKPGESFGNFKVVKCLCAGLIANYYHMQHIRDLHDVTVGILHYRVGKDMRLLKRLQTLQKTLRGFDHEGIPKISDCVEIDEHLCLFLDPVSGQTLSQYFETNATPGQQGISPEETARILAQLLGLLGYAHTLGIDHRDIDSDLVFIQEDGSIAVLGLGVKAALGTELFESIVSASVSPLVPSKTHRRLNSFDVMSPECQGGIAEDFRVDLFCAGTIGYWLLTGRKPNRVKLEIPTALVEGLSPQWDVFLQRLLERDQEARFQSCRIALLTLKGTDDGPETETSGFVQRQIDRIPVPKRILDCGAFATRVYRLFLIGVIGLTLAALASYFVRVVFMEEVDYRKDVARIVAVGQEPHLVVEVKPPFSRIEFSGFGKDFITNNGRLELRVIPGQYELRASAPHHADKVEKVVIKAGAQGAPQKISFDLIPDWSNIEVRSEPHATISVIDANGVEIELGATDDAGNFSLQQGLFAGTYQVIVRKQGFAPTVLKEQKLSLGEVSRIEAPLTPLPSSLTVRTSPPGAHITVNHVDAGMSPVVLDQMAPSDQYLVVAHLANYRSQGQRVEIKPGQDIVVDLGELIPKSAELQVAATVEGLSAAEARPLLQDTTVVLGDLRYPFGAEELKVVPTGKYAIRLEHPLYISAPQTLTLNDREVQQLSFTLAPRPGQVRLILPTGLEPRIRMNQRDIQWEGDWIDVPANEVVEFELSVENYLTMVRNFMLKPREKLEWQVQPVLIPGPVAGQDWALPYLGLELAWIPPGNFRMGSPIQEQGRLPNEGEQTEVIFTQGFWAGIYEVTQTEFREMMDQMPAEFIGARHPVDQVTWKEAHAFCQALTAREKAAGRLPTGYVYRLPTEAEWEYAARSGSTIPFHFGERADTSYGNFRGVYPRELDTGQRSTETYGTEPVGSYAPNAFGLYDMHGNVSEWTLEAYNGRLPGGRLTDPAPRTGGERYTLRGGSWQDFAVRVRAAARSEARIDTESNAIGFRVFLAPEK